MRKSPHWNVTSHKEFEQPKTLEEIQKLPIEERREILRELLRGNTQIIEGL